MSKKDFLNMAPAERDAEAKKWESGTSFEATRPLSKRSQSLWELAKRGRGRPRKPAGARARRVLISLDPELFARAEAFASSRGLDRSKLFALSLQAFIAADTAHRQAFAAGERRARKDRAQTTAASH
jgi:predicted transcriptional regulator